MSLKFSDFQSLLFLTNLRFDISLLETTKFNFEVKANFKIFD